jgi:hypothetical protein
MRSQNNKFIPSELNRDSTAKDFLVVRTEGKRQVKWPVQYILSNSSSDGKLDSASGT